MALKLLDWLVPQIQPFFPPYAGVDVGTAGSANTVVLSWHLTGDADRPNRRSRYIGIFFTRDAQEDYESNPVPMKLEANVRPNPCDRHTHVWI